MLVELAIVKWSLPITVSMDGLSCCCVSQNDIAAGRMDFEFSFEETFQNVSYLFEHAAASFLPTQLVLVFEWVERKSPACFILAVVSICGRYSARVTVALLQKGVQVVELFE